MIHGPFVTLDVLHRENLELVLGEFKIDTRKIRPSELDEFNLAWHRLDPWPDTVKGLRRLKAAHIIAPLSNGNIRLMIDMARWGGLPWDAILGAEVARAYKPMSEANLRTASALAISPNEICMVAAHNSDLGAAQNCGFETAFIVRPLEHGPNQVTDLKSEGDWDWVAPDLIELAPQLGA